MYIYKLYYFNCVVPVPPEYFSHIDHTGRRTDVLQRPELLYGTVEYAGTKDYCKVTESQGYTPTCTVYHCKYAARCHLSGVL